MSPSIPDCVSIEGGDVANTPHHQPGGDFLLALLAREEGAEPVDRADPSSPRVPSGSAAGVCAQGVEASADIPPGDAASFVNETQGEFGEWVSTGGKADFAARMPSPELLRRMVLLETNLPIAEMADQRQVPRGGDAGRYQELGRPIVPVRDDPGPGSAPRNDACAFSPSRSGLFHPGAFADIARATGNPVVAIGTMSLDGPASTNPSERTGARPAAVPMQLSHEPTRIQAGSPESGTGIHATPRDIGRLPADHAGRSSPSRTGASNETQDADRSSTPRRGGSAVGDEASRTAVPREQSDPGQGDEPWPSHKPSDAGPTSPQPAPDGRQSLAAVLDAFMPGRSRSVVSSTALVTDAEDGSGRVMPSAGGKNASTSGIAGLAARTRGGRHTEGAGATLSPSETQTLIAAFLDDLDGGASVTDAMAKYDPASPGFDPDATSGTIIEKLQGNPVLAQGVQTMLRDVAASGPASRAGRLTVGIAARQAGTAPVPACTSQTDAATNRWSAAAGVGELARGIGGITGVAMMLPEVSALWDAGALEHRARAAMRLKGVPDAEVDVAPPVGRRRASAMLKRFARVQRS